MRQGLLTPVLPLGCTPVLALTEDMTLTLAQASSLISSFAQLGASQPKMHAALCARAAQLLQQWLTAASSTSQVHTSTLTSASLQLPGSSVSTQSTQQQQLSAADLSHFASALNLSRQVAADSKSGILPASAALLDAIGSAAVSMAPHMDVAGLGEVCWLLHDARHHHPALLSAVSVRAEQLGRDWTLQRAAQEEQQGALGQVPDAAEADQHDVWALVKVLAYLNSFDAECWELLNQVKGKAFTLRVSAVYPCCIADPATCQTCIAVLVLQRVRFLPKSCKLLVTIVHLLKALLNLFTRPPCEGDVAPDVCHCGAAAAGNGRSTQPH